LRMTTTVLRNNGISVRWRWERSRIFIDTNLDCDYNCKKEDITMKRAAVNLILPFDEHAKALATVDKKNIHLRRIG